MNEFAVPHQTPVGTPAVASRCFSGSLETQSAVPWTEPRRAISV
jgi:hypothetical protein